MSSTILSLSLSQHLQKYTLFTVNVDVTHAPNSLSMSPEGSFPPSAVTQKELAMSSAMKQHDWVKSVEYLQPGINRVDSLRGSQGVTAFLLHEGTLLEWQEGYSHHSFAEPFTGMVLKSFTPFKHIWENIAREGGVPCVNSWVYIFSSCSDFLRGFSRAKTSLFQPVFGTCLL